MFVVVFLLDEKKHIIVPEEFICELDEQSLKNVGKNAHFRYKIYWTPLNDEGIPIAGYVPNFNLVKSTTFSVDGEACYVGKIKKFFSK